MGQHLAAEEGLDAAVFQQRHLLGVAQVGVGLVLDDARLAVDRRREQAAQRVGLGRALLVDLPDDRRRVVSSRSAVSLSALISLGV